MIVLNCFEFLGYFIKCVRQKHLPKSKVLSFTYRNRKKDLIMYLLAELRVWE